MTATTASARSSAHRGTAFGKYNLVRRLAVGGMAEVFVARSASGGVGRICVIKRILPEYCQSRQFVSMFIDEARILIGLNHHNIVRLYDFGHVDGSHYMALEYVPGCNLVEVLQLLFSNKAAMHPMAAAYVAREMLEGLHHAHSQQDAAGRLLNIVHRDVSPHNVLISHLGDVKVADFGIAQARNKSTLTVPGTVMGKFAYMAPEQAKGERVDARADVFAVGVVLHEALCGQRLFSATNASETLVKLVTMPAPAPSSLRPEVPAALDEIVLQALNKRAVDRFSTALEMSQALTELLARSGGYGPERFQEYLHALEIPEICSAGEATGPDTPRADKGRTVRLFVAAQAPAATEAPEAGLAAQWPEQKTHAVELKDGAIDALLSSFKQEPNLWLLVALGEHLRSVGKPHLAASAYRVASGAFAYRGLLVQGLVALSRARELISEKQWQNDIFFLWNLARADHAGLATFLERVDLCGLFALLQQADPEVFAPGAARPDDVDPVPLYGSVSAEHLVHLMRSARVSRYVPGTMIISQGESGDTLYAIGQGRVVVHLTPPDGDERIYVNALSEGDFFGEFGFLVGEPRSASVEAVEETWALEIDRAAVRSLIGIYPQMGDPLMDFYKTRVVELLMARNPIFRVLPPDVRRSMVASARLQKFKDQQLIVERGEEGDAFYFVKQGEVEVFTEAEGIPVFINKLRQGEFFGEIAVIRNVRRTASVRAMSEVEVLRVGREELLGALGKEPGLMEALEEAIEVRLKEQHEQVQSLRDLLR